MFEVLKCHIEIIEGNYSQMIIHDINIMTIKCEKINIKTQMRVGIIQLD